ncbi:hypothetical protein D9M71_104170 [compost metagenome]
MPVEYMLEGAVEDKAVALGHHRCLDVVGRPAVGTAERQDFLFVAECKLHRGAFCSFGGARVAPPL